MSIKLDPVAGLVIMTPANYSDPQVHDLLRTRWDWVWNKYSQYQDLTRQLVCAELVPGRRLLYLGTFRTLQVTSISQGSGSIQLSHDSIRLNLPEAVDTRLCQEAVKFALERWYYEQAFRHLTTRIQQLADELGLLPKRVRIKDQKTRWGSCSELGNINLNWRLIMAPESVIDYILVHELVHLRILNHSAAFWHQVAQHVPQYEKQQEWLERHASLMRL